MFHREGVRTVPGPESCIETIEGQIRLWSLVERVEMQVSLNRLLGR